MVSKIETMTIIFIIIEVNKRNEVDERRIDIHNEKINNIVMELNIDLIKFRVLIVNTLINVVAMIEKRQTRRKQDKIDVRGVLFKLSNVFNIKWNNFLAFTFENTLTLNLCVNCQF